MRDSLIPSFLVSYVSNRSGCSPKMSDHERISRFLERFAHFFTKNERFAQKTYERIPSPAFVLCSPRLGGGVAISKIYCSFVGGFLTMFLNCFHLLKVQGNPLICAATDCSTLFFPPATEELGIFLENLKLQMLKQA